MNTTEKRMTMIFNEWKRRYAEDPESFTESSLDSDGNPIEDYGELCMRFFIKVARDMDDKGLLPLPV